MPSIRITKPSRNKSRYRGAIAHPCRVGTSWSFRSAGSIAQSFRAVDYARSRSGDIRAVLVDVDPEETARVEIQWAQWGCGVPLTVLPSPYRSVLSSLLDYLEQVLQKDQECWVTVVIPEILPARWWQNILHNQRAFMLKGALLFKDRVILTDVPYHLTR